MPVNVLFLHAGGNWMRGSENALLTLLRGINRGKIVPLLLTSNEELAALASDEGIETAIHAMPEIMMEDGQLRLPFGLWIHTMRRILSFIKQRDIQLLYSNGGSTCQVGYYPAKLRGVPLICHIHSPYNRRYVLLYRFHLASKVIFVSKAIERSILLKQGFRAKCEVIHNGVDTERFRPAGQRDAKWRERLSLPQDAVVFGQVSSLIPRKGIDVLLRAFQLANRRHPEARLVLVGDGPEHMDYVRLASELGLTDKVSWTGHQADPLPFYQHVFDVNVLASRSDAFPLSVLEAAACELPTLGAKVDGIPEAVLDGQTGLLFESESHESLAEKMSELICAPFLGRHLGKAGRRLATEQFSVERYCGSIEKIILQQVQGIPMAVPGKDYAY
jgi:glycosyltransferase involved in cell wall biosynthesis